MKIKARQLINVHVQAMCERRSDGVREDESEKKSNILVCRLSRVGVTSQLRC